jgi:hypothetical protein
MCRANEPQRVKLPTVKELAYPLDGDLRRRLDESIGVFEDLQKCDLQWLQPGTPSTLSTRSVNESDRVSVHRRPNWGSDNRPRRDLR